MREIFTRPRKKLIFRQNYRITEFKFCIAIPVRKKYPRNASGAKNLIKNRVKRDCLVFLSGGTVKNDGE
jgi:hypothetical protein